TNIDFNDSTRNLIAGSSIDLSGFSDISGRILLESPIANDVTFIPPTFDASNTFISFFIGGYVWDCDLTNVSVNGSLTCTLTNATGFTFNASNKNCRSGLTLLNYTLNNTTDLDLTGLSDLGGVISLDGSNFRSITVGSNTTPVSRFLNRNNQNITSIDLNPLTVADSSLLIRFSNSPNMTSLILPSNPNATIISLLLGGSDFGYIDFTVLPNALNVNNALIELFSNNMTVEDVNHILVDLDTNTNAGFTGRVINMTGTNASPDATSGGFNGTAAAASLANKGVDVQVNP
ncbi:hypothetical protein OAH77_06300, partial [Flavobacteriaceae bacterium]|nr:hypothetical protein [Flavobacteriaceae bacterium]